MPAVTEAQIRDALRQVIDPELHHDVVELGFIQEIEIVGDYVHLDVQLTTPYCPFAEQIVGRMREAVAKLPGVSKVEIERACMKEDCAVRAPRRRHGAAGRHETLSPQFPHDSPPHPGSPGKEPETVARSLRDQVLALAGVFQSARLVQQLAREGRGDPEAFRTSVRSILAVDAASVDAVYGDMSGLRLGLTLLKDKLTGRSAPNDIEMARYVVAILHLEGVLRRQPQMLATIGTGIETAVTQMKFFEAGGDDADVHPALVDKLAELYSQTLSTLKPRIMVSGEHGHLMNPAIAARVRTALFAGIRSAVLWRQLGGRRWQLLFARGRVARTAAGLLANI